MTNKADDARDPNEILNQIRRADADQAAERKARYDRLVLDTAAGRADPGRVAAELKALGIPTDVFTAAVRRIVRRQELVSQVAAGRQATRELQEVRRRLEEKEAEREAMVQKFDREELAPLRAEVDRLRELQSGEHQARNELRQDAGPDLVARADELARQRDQMAARAERLREAVDSWRRAEERGDRNAAIHLPRQERELAEAEAQHAALSRQAAAAEAALLEAMPPTPDEGRDAPADGVPRGRWMP